MPKVETFPWHYSRIFMTCLNFSDHFVFWSFLSILIQNAFISYPKLADIDNEINSCLMHAHESFEPSQHNTMKDWRKICKFKSWGFLVSPSFFFVILDFYECGMMNCVALNTFLIAILTTFMRQFQFLSSSPMKFIRCLINIVWIIRNIKFKFNKEECHEC